MPDAGPDVRTELGAASLRPFHWLLVGLVTLATLFDGYATIIPSYIIHFVAKPWHLSPAAVGFLVSSGLIGLAVGSIVHGVIADRIGRRPTLIAGLLVSGVFSLLTAIAGGSYTSFVLLRVLTGFGLGVLLPLGTAYVNEYLPRRTQHRLAVLGGAGFALGGVMAALLGVALTGGGDWQSLFYVGGGALVLGVIYLGVFPESAEYLVAHGRVAEAVKLLAHIRPDRADVYRTVGLSAAPPSARDVRLVLAPDYRVRTIALWVSAFLMLFVIYGLVTWTPQLMIQRGNGFATSFLFGAILQGTSIVGAVIGGLLADRWLGVRRSLMLWCGLGAISALVIAFAGGTTVDVAAAAGAGLFLIGAQFLLNNICAITYPVEARGTGEGLMLGIGRIGGILGPTIGGALLGAFGGTSALFVVVAVASALAVASTSFVTGRATAAPSATPQEVPV